MTRSNKMSQCLTRCRVNTMSNKMSRQHLLMSGVAIVVCYYCSLVQTAVRAMMMCGVCIRAHVFGACMYIRTTMRIISHTPALEPIKANVSIKVKYHPHTQSREALLSARWSVSYSHGSATVRVQRRCTSPPRASMQVHEHGRQHESLTLPPRENSPSPPNSRREPLIPISLQKLLPLSARVSSQIRSCRR